MAVGHRTGVSVLLLAPVLLAGVFSLVRLATEGADVPDDADYAALTAHLRAQAAGDAVVVALPAWSLRVHQAARAAGVSIESGDGADRRPYARHGTVFVVVEPDGEDVLEARVAQFGEPVDRTRVGPFVVARFVPRGTLGFDLRARLKDTRVEVQGPDAVVCDRARKDGFACPGRKDWQRVTRGWQLVSENADDVIWAHPPAKGHILSIRADDVELGARLVVRAGFARSGAHKARAPVDIDVLVNGKKVQTVTRAPVFDFAVSEVPMPVTRGDLELRIHTANNGTSHFAFDAYTVRDP